MALKYSKADHMQVFIENKAICRCFRQDSCDLSAAKSNEYKYYNFEVFKNSKTEKCLISCFYSINCNPWITIIQCNLPLEMFPDPEDVKDQKDHSSNFFWHNYPALY